jgi:D-alanyl-D-alanine dipeptidase
MLFFTKQIPYLVAALSLMTTLCEGKEPSLRARLEARKDMVNVAPLVPGARVEMKYSTRDNFLGADVYGELDQCFLNRDAAKMLARANRALKKVRPKLRLLLYDCVRPVSVQRRMWDLVKDTPKRRYVASPQTEPGSMHNYGCAVDLTLADARGRPLDMGTPFDHLGRLAEPRHELEYRKSGKLTAEQLANRLLLRSVMVRAGFYVIPNEWWHFNCAKKEEVVSRYRKVE